MENANRKKVSVIIPVYKVENVLERCLNSLCRQSMQHIEIILVDDASPDRCGEICEQYAAQDCRFKVFHHPENRGLSAARNTGIAHATAEYLMFVDSDDCVHEDFCKLPYECAVQYQADLVMFYWQQIRENGSAMPINRAEGLNFGKLSRLEAVELMRNEILNTAWNKLYRKKLFKTVAYPVGHLYEDVGTTYKTILLADNIYFLDKTLYYHYYYEGSITTLKTERALRDWLEMYLQQFRDLAIWGYPANKLDYLLKNITLTYCMHKKADADDDNYVFCRKTLQSAKRIPEDFTWKRKVLFVLLKYCPPLFDLVCIVCGQRW